VKPWFLVPMLNDIFAQFLKHLGSKIKLMAIDSQIDWIFHDCIVSNTIDSYCNSINSFKKLKCYAERYHESKGIVDEVWFSILSVLRTAQIYHSALELRIMASHQSCLLIRNAGKTLSITIPYSCIWNEELWTEYVLKL